MVGTPASTPVTEFQTLPVNEGRDDRVEDMPWVVTGAAGFVGAHLSRRLLDDGYAVVGIDSFDPYYDPDYKRDRVASLVPDLDLRHLDLADDFAFQELCQSLEPTGIIHLAAQPGVRTGLTAPRSYGRQNLTSFIEVLEAVRHSTATQLIYASSSSVYGDTSPRPFDASEPADDPVSLYAATKRANELMAQSYVNLFGVQCTGLRFFTVYGPWGRPDMAYTIFADAIWNGTSIRVHGDGAAVRDLTYIDDVTESIARLTRLPVESVGSNRVLNIGHGGQITVLELIGLIEQRLGRPANVEFGDPVPGDVLATQANCDPLNELIGFAPQRSIEAGVATYCDWWIAQHRG